MLDEAVFRALLGEAPWGNFGRRALGQPDPAAPGPGPPRTQVLDTETKLLTHAIRIAAFNTRPCWPEPAPQQRVTPKPPTRPPPWSDALAGTGDIRSALGQLHIRHDPMHTARATAAIAELCTALNDTAAVFPGTDLQLHYSVKPHHRTPHQLLRYVRSLDAHTGCPQPGH